MTTDTRLDPMEGRCPTCGHPVVDHDLRREGTRCAHCQCWEPNLDLEREWIREDARR